MSKEYIAALITVLAQVLPFLGISVEIDALNVTANTLVTVVTGFYLLYKRVSRGDITPLGVRKK